MKLPKLTHINSDVAPFRVEVIIDGYYFEPAQGEMTFIKSPDVQFKKSEAKRPSVTTSFVVKQEEDEKRLDGRSPGLISPLAFRRLRFT